MNVANALAAAAAAWAAGAHLHDIRQGLRTFSTSFFQAPGRLNLIDLGGVRVIIDYCHNVDGMRQLADFVERMTTEPEPRGRAGAKAPARTAAPATGSRPRTGRAIGVIGIRRPPRRGSAQAGALAATARRIVVREDRNLRAGPVVGGQRRGREGRRRDRPHEEDHAILDDTAVRAALCRAARAT